MRIHLTWELPSTRVDGSPVTAADIDHVSVRESYEGAAFIEAAQVPSAGAQEYVLDGPAPGRYDYELVAVPVRGAASDSVPLGLDVPFAQLSVVVNPTIALEP